MRTSRRYRGSRANMGGIGEVRRRCDYFTGCRRRQASALAWCEKAAFHSESGPPTAAEKNKAFRKGRLGSVSVRRERLDEGGSLIKLSGAVMLRPASSATSTRSFSCVCMRCVSRSAVGWSLAASVDGKISRSGTRSTAFLAFHQLADHFFCGRHAVRFRNRRQLREILVAARGMHTQRADAFGDRIDSPARVRCIAFRTSGAAY